ncbi:MAG: IS1595 family transposase [Methylocella sp.]
MCKSTISTFELFAMFPDQETARIYLEQNLWPEGPKCPVCGMGERITTRKNGFYRCNQCKEDFTVRTGTIFERSHIPLHKWIYAMYLLLTARKGISSLQMSKEIGIRQASAWFMLHRIREACGPELKKLQGIVEIDETFIGGIEANKHEHKKLKAGRGTVGKTAVLGMREKGGTTFAVPLMSTDMETVQSEIFRHVAIGSTLHTDEAGAYAGIGDLFFEHDTVNHSESEFVRDGVTTNGVESVFAVLKRGLIGVYHHASKKHLGRYVDEFTFRLNEGNVKHHTLTRLESLIGAAAGKRLTYEDLIA